MSTTIDLACTKTAWVDKDNPTTNYHGAASYELQGYNDGLLILSFETLPQQYWGYKVESVTLYFTVNESLQESKAIFIYGASDGFDESTVTYDTRPGYAHLFGLPIVSSGSGDKEISFDFTDGGRTPENIHFSLRDPAIYFQRSVNISTGDSVSAYTNYAASGKRPFIRVVVSDTELLPDSEPEYPQESAREEGTVLADQPVTVSWLLFPYRDGDYGYGPVQSSAVFRWSTTNEAPWNEYEISNSDQNITFPANTFPAHGSIYWRVAITCYGGKTTSTSGYFHARLRAELPLLGGANVSTLRPDETKTWEYSVSSSTNMLGPKTESVDLFSFGDPPAEYAYNAIFNAGLYFKVYYSNTSETQVIGGNFYKLAGPFDASHVTWNTKPATQEKISNWTLKTDGSIPQFSMVQLPTYLSGGTTPETIKSNSLTALIFAKAKNILMEGPTTSFLHAEDRKAIIPHAPLTLRLWFLDTIVTSKPEAPVYASGYVNRHEAQTFTWDLVPDGDYYCIGGWTQESATFFYRAGTSGDWTEVDISGSEQSVTLAAETLAAGTVQWMVQTTDDQGTTAESEIYTLTTTDSTTTATPIVPKETLENGDAPIRFIWEVSNDHGTAPTGADLQRSNDGITWTTFAEISDTGVTKYDALAGTFTSGTCYWRVRAYNADGVAGAWSDPVTFVVVAAPPAPVVSADGKPYATISWQSSGQMAYRVTVDETSYGPYFGTVKSFQVPDFLTDGSHTATVEVQGEAGLWSQPGSVTFSVSNVPGDPISLTCKFNRDAELSWSTEATAADFFVYRDGVRIGHTSAKRFTDRFVLGQHEYFVVNKLAGGYYTRSNLATGTMRSCTRAVSAVNGGGWLEMALSDESDTTEEFAWSQVVSERYVTGSDLPVVETSPYRSGSGSYRISFSDVETGTAFESLRGQKIIVKSRGGNVAIGVLSGYQKTMTNFYINYAFTVRSCAWEDYVDETGD